MGKKEGLALVWSGATSGAYAACFGHWRKVTEVYAMLYGRQGKSYNTGRVSVAIRQLANAGFLKASKHESTTWRLYTATLKPVFDEAAFLGVEFDEKQRQFIEAYLGCAASRPVGAPTAPRIAFDKFAPLPAMERLRGELSALVALALVHLFFKQLEGYKIQAYVEALSQTLGTPGADVKPLSATPASDVAARLALEAREELSKTGGKPENTLLYRLMAYLHAGAYPELLDLGRQAV